MPVFRKKTEVPFIAVIKENMAVLFNVAAAETAVVAWRITFIILFATAMNSVRRPRTVVLILKV